MLLLLLAIHLFVLFSCDIYKYFIIQNIGILEIKLNLILLKECNKWDAFVIFRFAWHIISQYKSKYAYQQV